MIDPKLVPTSPDDWRKPDTSKPRSTAEFINDVWQCRQAPIYSLRPKELEILHSKTLRGWLWRTTMSLLRYSRPTSVSIQANTEGTEPTFSLACDPNVAPESLRTMEHYLAITRRWPTTDSPTPVETDDGVASTLCDSTDFRPRPSKRPWRPSKRSTQKKRTPRKLK